MSREYLRQFARKHGIWSMIKYVFAQVIKNPSEVVEALQQNKKEE
jgi:hypothetical protein